MRTNHSRQKQRSLKIVLIIILTLWVLAQVGKRIFPTSGAIISPLAEPVASKSKPKTSGSIMGTSKNTDQIVQQIKTLIDKQRGAYSVYISDLNSPNTFGLNETTIFTAASVNKIPILAALYSEAQNDKIDLDQRITVQNKDIQDYGTGIIRYEGAGGIYSLKTLAQLMIEKSDNTAAYILTNVIGQNRIQQLTQTWGMTQTDMENNKTSNKDMANLFTKMYRGEITNQALTLEMIGYLDESDFENRLPHLLPDKAVVYHKIGTEVGNIHDVGIIEYQGTTYYIGVMTNDISDEANTEAIIAQISKLVFDFMTKK